MSARKKTPPSLEKKIGHRFKDKDLLTQALTPRQRRRRRQI